tara:strand:+ start:9786 stop:10175 length:390 start_codon:yes stop_codon:yes gene_type:complete
MKNNVKTFEEFSDNVKIGNFSDMGKNWDVRRIVNKENGLKTFTLIDLNATENRLKKRNKEPQNINKRWEFKEYPSNADKVLYMTDEQAKELNDNLVTYTEGRKKYLELVDKYKSPTTTNPDFHRPKGEL